MIAGGELLRGRGRERYRRVQEALPRRWVVELSVSEHHVDGDPISDGRRLGWSWASSEGASRVKLEWGLDSSRCQEATNKSRAVEELSPEWMLLEPEADGGGRS